MVRFVIAAIVFGLAAFPLGALAGEDCPKGSRDCFPEDRVGVVPPDDDRGSGR
jgi:hypothetical protein